MLSFSTNNENIGTRLDRFLSKKIPDKPRSFIQKLIRAGCVKCNEQRLKKAHTRLAKNQKITVIIPEIPTKKKIANQKRKLNIIYEDQDLLAISKPAGLVMHPGSGHQQGTLVNYLTAYLGKNIAQGSAPDRPGLVHRLDKNTSGLILVAKTNYAYKKLINAFAERKISKTYLALVLGKIYPKKGLIKSGLRRDPHHREKMKAIKIGQGKTALTEYTVIKNIVIGERDCAWLEVNLLTGRMHQIRVHCQAIGHPIIGDLEYGEKKFNQILTKKYKLKRQVLHAWQLSLKHPRTKKKLTLEAKLPEEIKNFSPPKGSIEL